MPASFPFRRRALLIMGPTASGKSALAIALAEIARAHVINADALQVYGDLHVLSNRPGPRDLQRAPHALFGHIDGAQRTSVGAWLGEARGAIAGAWAQERNAIVVGGTGLYFKALTQGLVTTPAIDPQLRASLAKEAAQEGFEEMHQRLSALDPVVAGQIAPGDGPRILRALEVRLGTGQSLAVLRRQSTGGLARGEWCGICLSPDRDVLRARIAARFATMLAQGALQEAARLAGRGLPSDMPVMKALGLGWLLAHLAGDLSLAEAEALSVRDTQRYAKRQRTWMAHQMRDWHHLVGERPLDWLDAALAAWESQTPERG